MLLVYKPFLMPAFLAGCDFIWIQDTKKIRNLMLRRKIRATWKILLSNHIENKTIIWHIPESTKKCSFRCLKKFQTGLYSIRSSACRDQDLASSWSWKIVKIQIDFKTWPRQDQEKISSLSKHFFLGPFFSTYASLLSAVYYIEMMKVYLIIILYEKTFPNVSFK